MGNIFQTFFGRKRNIWWVDFGRLTSYLSSLLSVSEGGFAIPLGKRMLEVVRPFSVKVKLFFSQFSLSTQRNGEGENDSCEHVTPQATLYIPFLFLKKKRNFADWWNYGPRRTCGVDKAALHKRSYSLNYYFFFSSVKL